MGEMSGSGAERREGYRRNGRGLIAGAQTGLDSSREDGCDEEIRRTTWDSVRGI